MKAVEIKAYGGIDVLEINENAPKPAVNENQVLVEVGAASINPVDWKVREGWLRDMLPLNFPAVLGGDFSGTVAEIGGSVSGYNIGDEVYGQGSLMNGGSGAFAEFVAADINKIGHKPKSLDYIRAAALPLVGVSALQGLEEHIKLEQDQKILVTGGAGGIGHIAIQLAKNIGAYVATTVNARDKEFVKNIGADTVIDYNSENFEDVVKDYDAVFDNVGGEIADRSFKVIKRGGILVSMVDEPSKELAKSYGITSMRQGTNSNPEHFKKLSELADAGKLKVHVDRIFSLDEVKDAFHYKEAEHPRGKVVFSVK